MSETLNCNTTASNTPCACNATPKAQPAPAPAAPAAVPAPVAPKPAPKPAARGDEATLISPPKAAAPGKAAPAAPAAPVAPVAPAVAPQAAPAKAANEPDVDDWLNMAEDDNAAPAAEDDDLRSFFG